MTKQNTGAELDASNILSELDCLQKRHMNMLDDMHGHVSHEKLEPNLNTEHSGAVLYTGTHAGEPGNKNEADLDVFAKEIDLSLDSFESPGSFRTMTQKELIKEYLKQQAPISEQAESIRPKKLDMLDSYFMPTEEEPKDEHKIQNSIMDDENDIFSIPQNESESYDVLPPCTDTSAFDQLELEVSKKITKEKSSKQKIKVQKVISAGLFYGLLICLIGAAFFISQGDKKTVLGYSFLNVLTWSMESEIPQGSMVVVKKVDTNTIKIGDDITYTVDENTSITHRVIGITENFEGSGERGFETQGIESETPDFEVVPAVNVVGVVKFHIPKVGSWLEWLHEHLIITIMFTAGFVLLVVLIKGAFKKGDEKDEKYPSQPRRSKSASC